MVKLFCRENLKYSCRINFDLSVLSHFSLRSQGQHINQVLHHLDGRPVRMNLSDESFGSVTSSEGPEVFKLPAYGCRLSKDRHVMASQKVSLTVFVLGRKLGRGGITGK